MVKIRSKLILFGAGLSFIVPLLDQILNSLFHLFFFPNVLYYLPFLLIFPLSIGYSIVKHNLFDITAAIRQTFGYLLLTIGIVLLYFLVIIILSWFLGDLWQEKSHFLFLSDYFGRYVFVRLYSKTLSILCGPYFFSYGFRL